MPPRPRWDAYVVCPPGVEHVLAAEIEALGLRPQPRHGGVAIRATTRQLFAANLHLRTATRVLVRLAHFEARTFAELERHALDIAWDPWLPEDRPVKVRASASLSRLWHTGAVAERIARAAGRELAAGTGGADSDAGADGIGDGDHLDPGDPPLIVVRLHHDRVTVSIDSSGEPLHRRGYRRQTAKAPLRPTLAAAMLLAAGWEGQTPLVDPFCGSGTIPIEAAMIARRLAPGHDRRFAFESWPAFEPGTWASVRGAAVAAERPLAPVRIVARDRDVGAVAATAANATRAGVHDDLDLAAAAVSDLTAPAGAPPGWLVTNPPYGRRVSRNHDLRDLYARLGQVVDERLPGWSVGILTDDVAAAGHAKLRLAERWRSANGGIDVRYLVGGAAAVTDA